MYKPGSRLRESLRTPGIHELRRKLAAEHRAGWLRRDTTLPDLQEGRFEDAEEDEEEPTETGQHHS